MIKISRGIIQSNLHVAIVCHNSSSDADEDSGNLHELQMDRNQSLIRTGEMTVLSTSAKMDLQFRR